ncbi:helix-turn-helix domain-containing protein [Methylomonas koyamae]|uniref:helix-turn-helix domain-containing protein n=1 Tax=Methylomonas koyamae TaxID=702114 RepID=UPI002873874B|nr:helix-turn-helix domain-containing protein [Methylomonas koyamae]WNB74548.1 helix-turn-helix domain-containing protein [Methylomonas koyamae]
MTEDTKKRGRPRGYKPEYVQLAHNYTLLGAPQEQLGEFFNVAVETIEVWIKRHPEFADAIKQGRILADAEVAANLFRRATGYQHSETTTRETRSASGVVLSIESVTVTREIPPDTDACIFWLKNRQPDKWRDRTEVVHYDQPKPEAQDDGTAEPNQDANA